MSALGLPSTDFEAGWEDFGLEDEDETIGETGKEEGDDSVKGKAGKEKEGEPGKTSKKKEKGETIATGDLESGKKEEGEIREKRKKEGNTTATDEKGEKSKGRRKRRTCIAAKPPVKKFCTRQTTGPLPSWSKSLSADNPLTS